MNELALFAGVGGSILAGKLLGWRCVGAVEIEAYPQKILQARIADGSLGPFPIFGDIRQFIREGYAESYTGMVDVVSGGFPCQDISTAGKGAGIKKGKRSSLWKSMLKVVSIVQPRFVFVENVRALVSRGLDTVLRGLAILGYDIAWDCFRASDVGAPHRRERVFILGTRRGVDDSGSEQRSRDAGTPPEPHRDGPNDGLSRASGCDVGNTPQHGRREGRPESELWSRRDSAAEPGGNVADADEERQPRLSERARAPFTSPGISGGFTFPPGPSDAAGWAAYLASGGPEPALRRGSSRISATVDDPFIYRVSRLKALGNAWVPHCAAVAFIVLSERLETHRVGVI